jgi:hypothetical protein
MRTLLYPDKQVVASTRRAQPVDETLLARIMGEFDEMPGMSLTLKQAERLWHLDESTCRTALTKLVQRHKLVLTPRGRYMRGDRHGG